MLAFLNYHANRHCTEGEKSCCIQTWTLRENTYHLCWTLVPDFMPLCSSLGSAVMLLMITQYVFSPLVYNILIYEDYAHHFQNFQLKFSEIHWIWGLLLLISSEIFFRYTLFKQLSFSSILFLLSFWSAHGMHAQLLSCFQSFWPHGLYVAHQAPLS